jgi:hypothetical protein
VPDYCGSVDRRVLSHKASQKRERMTER